MNYLLLLVLLPETYKDLAKLNILKMKIVLICPSAEEKTVKETARRWNLLSNETRFRWVLDLVMIGEGATL